MAEKRPSKKQYELLTYIDSFIKGNGYGPSYREIMRALDYRSVSTVAVHVDGLIARGLLRKKDNSARSLEVVVDAGETNPESTEKLPHAHEEWLMKEIAMRTKRFEIEPSDILRQELVVLQETVRILGLGVSTDSKV